MIPNHAQFLTAIQEHKKVWLRFYSTADSGVLDHICAPLDYGPGSGIEDGLNRYWLWDYASSTGSHNLGLLPKQIVELQMLGDLFDPSEFASDLLPTPIKPPAAAVASDVAPNRVG